MLDLFTKWDNIYNLRNFRELYCEENHGTHLRIFVWNLLMNLKSNDLLKKLLKWANKKCKNFKK